MQVLDWGGRGPTLLFMPGYGMNSGYTITQLFVDRRADVTRAMRRFLGRVLPPAS